MTSESEHNRTHKRAGRPKIVAEFCAVNGCETKPRQQINGVSFCDTHMYRYKAGTDLHRRASRKMLPDACEIEGCDKKPQAKVGGLAACPTHYARHRNTGSFDPRPRKLPKRSYTKPCQYCGNVFLTNFKLQKYCPDCKGSSGGLKETLAVSSGLREIRKPYGPNVCLACNKSFMSAYKGAVVCSKQCNYEWLKIRPDPERDSKAKETAARRESVRQESNVYRSWSRRYKRKLRTDQAQMRRKVMSAALHAITCRECGDWFETKIKTSMLCSDSCRKRESGRAGKQRRRVRLMGAKVETVKATKVFERDMWRCQMCGIKTPRRKRGTCEPDAPELDHIIPVAKGGEHTYMNTQCLCRACNASKSDTILGQLRMFGGVAA